MLQCVVGLGGLIYRPFFAPEVVVAAALGVAGLAVWAWWRSRTPGRSPLGSGGGRLGVVGLVMRLMAVGVVGWLLMGPSVLPETRDPSPTPVVVAVDASASMQTRDMGGEADGSGEDGETRYGFALERWLSEEQLAALREHHDVRVYSFGGRPRATVPEPAAADARESRVVDSVYELITTMRTNVGSNTLEAELRNSGGGGGLVVVSDGRDSGDADPGPAAALAVSRGVKVHTVTLGGATRSRDVALGASPGQPFLMVDEPGTIDVRLTPTHAGGASTTLRVRYDGEETTRPVTFEGDQRVRVELPVSHDEPGLYTYEIAVDPLPGEAESNNNTQTVFVEVTERRMRVLVLEGQPYWDTKFLAQSLRKDDRVAVTHITQVTPDRPSRTVTRAEGPATTPATLADWSRYDLVVLGRRLENVLSAEAARALLEYVAERGGRVVLARGRPHGLDTAAGRSIGRAWSAAMPVAWDEDGVSAGRGLG
ncbi:MAG: hypothetical protein AAFX76_14495, partial [Planctomycetota bacterium]